VKHTIARLRRLWQPRHRPCCHRSGEARCCCCWARMHPKRWLPRAAWQQSSANGKCVCEHGQTERPSRTKSRERVPFGMKHAKLRKKGEKRERVTYLSLGRGVLELDRDWRGIRWKQFCPQVPPLFGKLVVCQCLDVLELYTIFCK